MEQAMKTLFWRILKWLIHLFTGNCEVYRVCVSNIEIETKAMTVEQSLRNSRCQALKNLVTDTHLNVDQSVEIIIKEKHISSTAKTKLLPRLRPVMLRVRSVLLLIGEIEELRKQPYSQDNQSHESCLMELWTLLNPGISLEKRITKQWQDIGFQGDNPATDFRGMGVLSLYSLRYFACHYCDHARAVLLHSHHPSYGYPYALVGINLTSMVYCWLESGKMNAYFYLKCLEWPLQLKEFHEIFCYLFVEFDKFWINKKPANVMSFPVVRDEFKIHIEHQLVNVTTSDFHMKLIL